MCYFECFSFIFLFFFLGFLSARRVYYVQFTFLYLKYNRIDLTFNPYLITTRNSSANLDLKFSFLGYFLFQFFCYLLIFRLNFNQMKIDIKFSLFASKISFLTIAESTFSPLRKGNNRCTIRFDNERAVSYRIEPKYPESFPTPLPVSSFSSPPHFFAQ